MGNWAQSHWGPSDELYRITQNNSPKDRKVGTFIPHWLPIASSVNSPKLQNWTCRLWAAFPRFKESLRQKSKSSQGMHLKWDTSHMCRIVYHAALKSDGLRNVARGTKSICCSQTESLFLYSETWNTLTLLNGKWHTRSTV